MEQKEQEQAASQQFHACPSHCHLAQEAEGDMSTGQLRAEKAPVLESYELYNHRRVGLAGTSQGHLAHPLPDHGRIISG